MTWEVRGPTIVGDVKHVVQNSIYLAGPQEGHGPVPPKMPLITNLGMLDAKSSNTLAYIVLHTCRVEIVTFLKTRTHPCSVSF